MLLVAAGANAPTEAARRIKEAGEIFIVVFLFVDTAIKPSNAVFRECGPLAVVERHRCLKRFDLPPRTSSFPGLFLNVPFCLTQKLVHYRSEILLLPPLHHFFLSPSQVLKSNHEQSPRKSKVHGKGGRR